eukprot:Sspe_Gene.75192::Locus_46994_Transcript_1_1_Confidence_1.000_Length_759::g.75192::m.75192
MSSGAYSPAYSPAAMSLQPQFNHSISCYSNNSSFAMSISPRVQKASPRKAMHPNMTIPRLQLSGLLRPTDAGAMASARDLLASTRKELASARGSARSTTNAAELRKELETREEDLLRCVELGEKLMQRIHELEEEIEDFQAATAEGLNVVELVGIKHDLEEENKALTSENFQLKKQVKDLSKLLNLQIAEGLYQGELLESAKLAAEEARRGAERSREMMQEGAMWAERLAMMQYH